MLGTHNDDILFFKGIDNGLNRINKLMPKKLFIIQHNSDATTHSGIVADRVISMPTRIVFTISREHRNQ